MEFIGAPNVWWHSFLIQWRAPNGSVAVSMICHQRTRSLAFLQAEWISMLADCTLASIPLSQVVRGRPRGLLQSLGGQSDALTGIGTCYMAKEAEASF